ncbi:MAG TPA: proline dehydrogenase family protein [Candidatus Acidoferrales bacterium]|nr:proline dehydrogenase family protein [Candidatus Acidoferrales bacterium]
MIRATLIALSQNARAKRFVLSNGLARRTARRFVAGEELDDAVAAARAANDAGLKVSLDFLGENVATREAAERAREMYLGIFERIAKEKLDANVSLKLTQLGMDFGEEFCREQILPIVKHAESLGNFLRMDMEGSAYTQRTVEMAVGLRRESAAVGTVIQSYLHRSEADIRALVEAGCRVRLCKGAYLEPPEIAFAEKKDVDANYVKLMRLLLPSGVYHAMATHDPAMIAATKEFAAEQGIAKDKFEFQMLYGIRPDLQRELIREGYRMRVYIPYGRDWFPYFMRRLAERPANLMFIARNLFRRAG